MAQFDDSLLKSVDDMLIPTDEYALGRTLYFNSTGLLVGVAVGAVLILGIGVALYLYDYFADTSRSEPLPNPDYTQYYQDQYQNSEYASYYR